jgi:signal transduction histidine kinase
MLERVFTNLLSNAVKYNDKGSPEIKVTYNRAGEYHEFTVEDNGIGIEARYFDKIFEIFQTLQERDAFESTGVGLAIVKKILEDNNGWIKVTSKRGVGSAFTLGWPVKRKNEKH